MKGDGNDGWPPVTEKPMGPRDVAGWVAKMTPEERFTLLTIERPPAVIVSPGFLRRWCGWTETRSFGRGDNDEP